MIDEFLAGLRGVLLEAEAEAANPTDVVTALALGLAAAITTGVRKIPAEARYGEDAVDGALAAIAAAFAGTRPKVDESVTA